MKHRRFPIVPVTALVVLIGGAVIMTSKPFDQQNRGQEIPEEVVSESRGETSKEQIAAMASKQAGTKRSNLDPETQAASGEPAILLPYTQDYKPTQNPTATSQQWYKDGAKAGS